MCWYNANTHSCKFIWRCIKYFKSYKGTFPQTACCRLCQQNPHHLSQKKDRKKCLSSLFDRTNVTHHGHFQISCRYIQQHFPCWFVQISPVGLSNWCLGRWRTHSRPSTSVVDAFLSISLDQNFLLTHMCCFLFSLHRTTRAMPHPCCCFLTHTQHTHTPTDTASHHDS